MTQTRICRGVRTVLGVKLSDLSRLSVEKNFGEHYLEVLRASSNLERLPDALCRPWVRARVTFVIHALYLGHLINRCFMTACITVAYHSRCWSSYHAVSESRGGAADRMTSRRHSMPGAVTDGAQLISILAIDRHAARRRNHVHLAAIGDHVCTIDRVTQHNLMTSTVAYPELFIVDAHLSIGGSRRKIGSFHILD